MHREDLGADLVKPYPVNNQMMNQTLELRHGKAVKAWPMDRISDSQFTDVCTTSPKIEIHF
jgi:RNA polymerase-associated protein RTF1